MSWTPTVTLLGVRGKMHCVNGALSPWIPHRKIFMGIHAQIKTARRKVASTEQFIKATVYSQGGRGSSFLEIQPALRWFWNWMLLAVCGAGGMWDAVGWSLMEALPIIWEPPPTGREREFLMLQGLCQNCQGKLLSIQGDCTCNANEL